MEQPLFIKCEPDWVSDGGQSYNLESNEEAATDKLGEVKCEPADPKTGKLAEEFVKEEHEFQDVEEAAQNEASPACWFQPLYTAVVEIEMSNIDEHHPKEINGSNITASDSSAVGPTASSLPEEGLKCDSQISGNAPSTEGLFKKHMSVRSLVTMSEKKCSHSFETIGKNVYCCKKCDYRAYPCSMCDKYFINRSSMYRHQRKHSQDSWLCCNFCGKAFNDRSNLGRHMLSHGQNKQYECSTCGKAFSLRFQLKNHVMIHSKNRPFSCHICNESFTRKGTLKAHVLTHTGVKSFKCTKCDRAFLRLPSLRKHLLVHNKLPLSCTCNVCGKTFSKRKYMKAHAPVHEQKDSFPCELCGKSFNNKNYLKRHILRHTAKESS